MRTPRPWRGPLRSLKHAYELLARKADVLLHLAQRRLGGHPVRDGLLRQRGHLAARQGESADVEGSKVRRLAKYVSTRPSVSRSLLKASSCVLMPRPLNLPRMGYSLQARQSCREWTEVSRTRARGPAFPASGPPSAYKKCAKHRCAITRLVAQSSLSSIDLLAGDSGSIVSAGVWQVF